MRIVLGITMRNEIEYGPHAEWQIKDALEMDYDDIVVLDDGSNDGTYELLKEYELKDKRLHIFRNNKNSIKDPEGINRWKTLVGHMAEYDPTWMNVRAADQIYSHFYKNNIRKVLEYFLEKNAHVIRYPLVHLWRSESWYRADDVWGGDLWNHNKFQVWRFNKNYSYGEKQSTAVLHQGRHVPINLGFKDTLKYVDVNDYFEDNNFGKDTGEYYPIIVLHYGHTTHEKKEAKFKLSMEVAKPSMAKGMPSADIMPSPNRWLIYNGYKGFHEFSLELERVPEMWFSEDFVHEEMPKIKSFYNMLLDYNKKTAKEYKEMYEQFIPEHMRCIEEIKEKVNTENMEIEVPVIEKPLTKRIKKKIRKNIIIPKHEGELR